MALQFTHQFHISHLIQQTWNWIVQVVLSLSNLPKVTQDESEPGPEWVSGLIYRWSLTYDCPAYDVFYFTVVQK